MEILAYALTGMQPGLLVYTFDGQDVRGVLGTSIPRQSDE
jgi:hypothetical protein